MQSLLVRLFLGILIVTFTAGPAGAFDLTIGHLPCGPSPVDATAQPYQNAAGFGAMISVPLDLSGAKPATATLNGVDVAHFTKEDAHDSLIVIMLFGVAIAAGALTVSVSSN